MRQWLCLIAITAGIGFVSGCGNSGPKRNSVAGTVSFKGEPVKYGSISFRSTGGGKNVGTADIIDGKYTIISEVGLPAGDYDVAITYPDPKVPAPRGDEPPGVAAPVREMLPAKYNDKSELKATIKDGANDTVNYDLK